MVAGLGLSIWTIALLVRRGERAAWPPPGLVIRGPYRHVRNPMILAGALVLGGEAVGLRS